MTWLSIIRNQEFVSISSLTGKCAAQKLQNFCSSSLWTCLHHMVMLISQNKITDYFMILAWACPFKGHLHGELLWSSITLTCNVFTELSEKIKYGWVLYNIAFTEYPFKRVSDDVIAFHRILWNTLTSLGENKVI